VKDPRRSSLDRPHKLLTLVQEDETTTPWTLSPSHAAEPLSPSHAEGRRITLGAKFHAAVDNNDGVIDAPVKGEDTESKTSISKLVRQGTDEINLSILPKDDEVDHDSVIAKYLELPSEYKSVYRASFSVSQSSDLEKAFLANTLEHSLHIGRCAIGLGILAICVEFIVGLIDPKTSFSLTGVSVDESWCKNDTEDFMQFRLAKNILKFYFGIPFSLALIFISYIKKFRTLIPFFLGFVIVFVGLWLIAISIAGLRPTHRMLDLYIFIGFNISNTSFSCK
jgi:hypothetical protein